MAQQQLGDGEFARVAGAIPGIDNLIGEAFSGGKGIAGAVCGLAGTLGSGSGGQLANMAALAGGFSQAGLNPGIASKFVPIILSSVQSKGGEGAKNILAGVLK